jgi:UDP-glucose 4-epimerase
MNILITGGAGYIGSHLAVDLLKSRKNKIFIIDNFINSHFKTIINIKKITKRNFIFEKIDLLKKKKLDLFFYKHKIDIVIHLAGLKSISESETKPFNYLNTNIVSALNLLSCMSKYSVRKIIFSSTAAVYGIPNYLPIDEKHLIKPISTYGKSKEIIENILINLCNHNKIKTVILRYFNPVGAHKSGLIGENPKNLPQNLMPVILNVISKNTSHLKIYGKDYKTKDKTAERDYIHINDLVRAHIKSIKLFSKNFSYQIINVGTGRVYSVLEFLNIFQKVNNLKIDYKFYPRRKGDVEKLLNDIKLSKKILKFKSRSSLEEACVSAYNYFIKNNLL